MIEKNVGVVNHKNLAIDLQSFGGRIGKGLLKFGLKSQISNPDLTNPDLILLYP